MKRRNIIIKNPMQKLFVAIDSGDIDKVLAMIVYAPNLLKMTPVIRYCKPELGVTCK